MCGRQFNVYGTNAEPLFKAKDVATFIGHSDVSTMTRCVDDDEKVTKEHSILVGELARIIKQNGVEIGQNRLFAWFRDNGYLCKKGEMYNQPTQKALGMGLFEIKKTVIQKPNGNSLVTTTTKVTGKGQIYFVNKFLFTTIGTGSTSIEKGGKA